MKVRWKQNSLRLRITPSELEALQKGVMVREEMRLPFALSPVWEVVIVPEGQQTRIESCGNTVNVVLESQDIRKLSQADSEGVYFSADGGTVPFQYYIEKDFPCIHPRSLEAGEDATETFAPPLDFALRK